MPHRPLAAAVTVFALLAVAPAARAGWVWPVSGELITPYRNGDDPYAAGQHRGIDIAAPVGTAVVAAAGGEVRFAGTAGSSGLTVSIRSADGLYDTSYLHLSSFAVDKGDRVATGDQIGAVGTTGRRSATAAHLHFGVRDAGTRHAYRDPLTLLPPAPGPEKHPRPAPAPSPTAVPVAPAPEPAAEVKPTPTPRHVSIPERDRIPLSIPRPTLVAAPRAGPQLGPAPHGPRRGAVRDTPPEALRAPREALRGAPPEALRGAPDAAAGAAPDARPGRAPSSASQPALDPGYALACVGLLLAAALLGLSEDGRQASRRSRDRIVHTLRPLLGRRP